MKQGRFCLPRLAFLRLRIVNRVRLYKKTVFSFLMKRLDNVDPTMSSIIICHQAPSSSSFLPPDQQFQHFSALKPKPAHSTIVQFQRGN